MAPKRNSSRHHPLRPEKTISRKIGDFIRAVLAFIFSNLGIVCLIVGYTIAGAFLFIAVESPDEVEEVDLVEALRAETTMRLWNTTLYYNMFSEEDWKKVVADEIMHFQTEIVKYVQDGDYEGGASRWSFSAAFLYSLTVITTIGYGNITPRTDWGKFATVVYAIGGMPIFLLYLSNIGTLLAKSCKWSYAKCVLCRNCEPRPRKDIKPKNVIVKPSLVNEMDSRNPELIGKVQGNTIAEDEDDEEEDDENLDLQTITVPVSLCLAIMVLYVCGGAILFAEWEKWDMLDGAYFCFISLSTIGFGDLVPGAMTRKADRIEIEFIFCSTYLLMGMALIAMCFNLMQEEVVHKLKTWWSTVRSVLRIEP